MDITPFLAERNGTLARRSVRATVATSAAAALDFAIRLGSVAVLARLVSPSDFGIVMIAGAAVAVAEQFRDLGLPSATLQRPGLTAAEVTSLFWINAGAGALLALLLCISSPLLATVLDEPRLIPLTCAFSLTVFTGGLAVQHQALLGRQLLLGRLAAVRVAAGLLATGFSVWLAARGAGCWALLGREVTRSALLTAGTWWLLPWRPGAPGSLSAVRPHLRFGADVLGANLLGALAASSDRLILGRFGGPAAVGLYRQAVQLVSTPTDQLLGPLYQVAQPALSRVQREPERYQRAYGRLLTLVSLATIPISLLLAVFAEEATLVLLGPAWTEAVPVVRILCVAALFRQTVGSTALILLTRGDARACLRLAALNQILLLPALLLGATGGPAGVALAEVVVAILMILPRLRTACANSPVGIRFFLTTIARPLAAAGLMTLGILAARPALEAFGPGARLALGGGLGAAAFTLAWLALPGGRASVSGLLNELRTALRPAAAAAPS
jgi:PST family polysaccharide transporter